MTARSTNPETKLPLTPPVEVRHPPVGDAGIAAQEQFARCLAEGFEEWGRRMGVDASQLAELKRGHLLAQIDSLLTTEEVSKILNLIDQHDRDEHIAALVDQISGIVRVTLSTGPAKPGAKRIQALRDEKAYGMRQCGVSYGRIGNRLRMTRNAVQAACRREQQRRERFHELYRQLKQGLEPLGIVLAEDVVDPRV